MQRKFSSARRRCLNLASRLSMVIAAKVKPARGKSRFGLLGTACCLEEVAAQVFVVVTRDESDRQDASSSLGRIAPSHASCSTVNAIRRHHQHRTQAAKVRQQGR